MIWDLADLSEQIAPLRGRWRIALPPCSPALGINFPLISFAKHHYSYGDETFPMDLAVGMPIAGVIPATGALRPRFRPNAYSIEQWRAGLPVRNRHLLGRAIKSAKSEMSVGRGGQKMADVKRGWVTKHTPVSNATLNSAALTSRYAIPSATVAAPRRSGLSTTTAHPVLTKR